jgi:uncharacterized protein YciI
MAEFLIISNLINNQKTSSHREEHQNYLSRLKKEGKLILAGRFSNGKGGAYIISANSQKEAEEITFNDPYHRNGLRKYSIFGWERKI